MGKFIYIVRIIIVALLSWLFCGCTTNIRSYGVIDPTNKTVYIPFSNGDSVGNLEQHLKTAFRQEGWEVLSQNVGKDVAITQHQLNNNLLTESGFSPGARYYLHCQYSVGDLSFTDGWIYHFEITLLDQMSGKDVVDMSGYNTKTPIIRKLLRTLKEIEKIE